MLRTRIRGRRLSGATEVSSYCAQAQGKHRATGMGFLCVPRDRMALAAARKLAEQPGEFFGIHFD
jgi:hypothetical protein